MNGMVDRLTADGMLTDEDALVWNRRAARFLVLVDVVWRQHRHLSHDAHLAGDHTSVFHRLLVVSERGRRAHRKQHGHHDQ